MSQPLRSEALRPPIVMASPAKFSPPLTSLAPYAKKNQLPARLPWQTEKSEESKIFDKLSGRIETDGL